MSEIELHVTKKMKLNDNEEATIQDGDGIEVQCKHFVLRKKRYCKMTVAKGDYLD